MRLKRRITTDEARTIMAIANRATNLNMGKHEDVTRDLRMCHGRACKLDLDKLLAASDFDFAHDIVGIAQHLNYHGGFMKDCFVPVYAANEEIA